MAGIVKSPIKENFFLFIHIFIAASLMSINSHILILISYLHFSWRNVYNVI